MDEDSPNVQVKIVIDTSIETFTKQFTAIVELGFTEIEATFERIGDRLDALHGKTSELKNTIRKAALKRRIHRTQVARLADSFTTIYEGFDYSTPAMKTSLRKLAELYNQSSASKDQLIHIIAVQQSLFMQLIDAKWVGKPTPPKYSLALRTFTLKYCQQLPGKASSAKRAWVEVLKFLDYADIVRFSKTSNENYRTAYDEEVWRQLYNRSYNLLLYSEPQIDNWRLKFAYNASYSCSVCKKIDEATYSKAKVKYCNVCKMQLPEFKPAPPVVNSYYPSTPSYEGRMGYAVQCNATTLRGARCRRTTKNSSGYCWQH